MGDFWLKLTDTTGFTPRKSCGDWSPELVWMHVGSDLAIWLAYVSIPLVLFYFAAHYRRLPFKPLFWLFAAFILACGSTHFLDAVMFEYPVYRLMGLAKLGTAVISLATVVALVPTIPKAVEFIRRGEERAVDTVVHRALRPKARSRPGDYIIALLAATMAILVRAALDPLVTSDHVFVLSLLAVVFVAWQCGFGPALVTLGASMAAFVYFFVHPRYSLLVTNFGDQVAIALFAFCGLACAVLGEAQRHANRKAARALADAVQKRTDLEFEVSRRTEVEYSLRDREERLVEANARLTAAQRQTADALALLDGFFQNAPVGLAFFDPQLKFVRVNDYLARANGVPAEAHVGRGLAEVLPHFPREGLEAYRRVLATREPVRDMALIGTGPGAAAAAAWELNIYPVARPGGEVLGVGVVARDVTDRERAAAAAAEQARLAGLRADVSARLAGNDPPRVVLQQCCELIVRYLDAAFARVWTLNAADQVLELQASAGLYTHLDGPHARVPVGQFKIGRIAAARTPHLSNAVPDDPEIGDRAWAQREGMAAFAGYPLVVGDGVMGVLALFARRPLSDAVLADLAPLADGIAQWLSRQRAVASLREAEGRFRSMADSIPQLAWMTRPDGHIFWYNRRWYEYTGTTFEDMQGWGWRSVHDPDELPKVMDRWGASLASGEPFDMVFPLKGKDGRFRPFLSRAEPVRDAGGRVTLWFGTNTDISDQRAAETALRETAARFRSLTEAVPHIVWVTRPDGFHEYFNARWYEYTGLSPEESLGGGWAVPLHPDDVDRSAARWKQSTDAGTAYEIEYRFRRHDGAYRWFLARAVPVRNAAGEVVQWFGTCTDVDDQRRQADALRASEGRFRLLTEAIPNMVWNADAGGEATYFNARWVEYTGLAVADCTGAGWMAAVHPDDRERAAAGWTDAVRQGSDRFSTELRLRRGADGGFRWMLSDALPLRRGDGAVDQWIGAMTDIDDQKRRRETLEAQVLERTAALTAANAALVSEVEERKRAEGRVRDTAAELTRSNEELEKFAYVASHDLQEPLRKIQAFGDRLGTRHKDQLDGPGHDYLSRMLASAGRMRRLIDDLLTFSRVTSKGQAFARVDLNEVAAGVVSDLEVRIAQAGATVDVGPLPAVSADPSQMHQVLLNLIGNALKFQRPGVPPVVTVRGEVAADGGGRAVCRLAVADNGIGFDIKYLDRIFQVFQRLHGRDEYEGTGVGLAICRKIVERHGGTITATSTKGEGATFLVALPVDHREEQGPHGE